MKIVLLFLHSLVSEEENDFSFYKLHFILCFNDMENGEVQLEVERQ